MLTDISKIEKFKLLEESATHCRLCDRLYERKKILSEKNGDINSNILFIAEAPGRYGADKTGVPLYGDQTGKLFQYMLDTVGLERRKIFITNSILCNPRNQKGNNVTPKLEEIKNCSTYLNILISIIEPKIIVTLGTVALKALNYIKSHKVNLKYDVRSIIDWNSFILMPLYHPGPRARIFRDLSHQISDFFFLKEFIRKYISSFKMNNIYKIKEQTLFNNYIVPTNMQKLIIYIVDSINKVTKFKLTKLIYLIDYEFLKINKRLFTESFYIYQNAGPLQTTLTKRLQELEGFEIKKLYEKSKIIYKLGDKFRFKINFNENEKRLIDKVLNKFKDYNDRSIKTTVYLTEPMRYFLKKRKEGINEINRPVFHDIKK